VVQWSVAVAEARWPGVFAKSQRTTDNGNGPPSSGSYTAFIHWPFQRENTPLGRAQEWDPAVHGPFDDSTNEDILRGRVVRMAGADEYLRMLAIARLFFDNIPSLQSSWVTMGPKVGQLALFFGANDMGSVMMEENVVSAAGTTYKLNEREICRLIRDAGWVPAQRDQYYPRDILARYVELAGYEYVTASNGWEALLSVDQNHIDLILLDVMMPGMDGVTFLNILRNAQTKRTTPVIIVTAMSKQELGSRFRELPVQAILPKTQELFDELMVTVRRILGEASAQAPSAAKMRPRQQTEVPTGN
jgi:CheY-like chemotaxis protein